MNDRAVSVSCVNALLAFLTFGLYHTLHPKPSRLRGTIKDVAELIKLSVTEHVATRPLCGGHRLLYQSSNVTKQAAVKSKREKKGRIKATLLSRAVALKQQLSNLLGKSSAGANCHGSIRPGCLQQLLCPPVFGAEG